MPNVLSVTAKQISIDHLPSLDPASVTKAAQIIHRHVSTIDYGTRTGEGDLYRTSGTQLEQHFNKKKFIKALTQKDIVFHFAQERTIYYTTRRGTGYLLACFDFDWKDEHKAEWGDQNDALAAAKFVMVDLDLDDDQVYIEPSTNGEGIHMYAFIYTGDTPAYQVQEIATALSNVVRYKVQDERFLCSFDKIFGTPSTKQVRGFMAKIPRLNSQDRVNAFTNLRMIPLAKVQEYIALNTNSSNTITDCGITVPQTAGTGILEGTLKTTVTNTITDCGINQSLPVVQTLLPIDRMRWCCQQLCRKLKRALLETESQLLIDEYERLNLHTGSDEQRKRERRAIACIKYVSKSFDPSLVGSGNMPLIRSHINSLGLDSAQLTCSNGTILKIELLERWVHYFVAVFSITHKDSRLDGTVNMNHALKQLRMQKIEYYKCKELAQTHDLILTASNSYIVGKKSKTYCIGSSLKQLIGKESR
jgi:hypothetical protein